MLGYRTYHGFEFVKNGKRDMDLLTEALEAKHYGVCHPYGRAEFDKLFGDYDVRRTPSPPCSRARVE